MGSKPIQEQPTVEGIGDLSGGSLAEALAAIKKLAEDKGTKLSIKPNYVILNRQGEFIGFTEVKEIMEEDNEEGI